MNVGGKYNWKGQPERLVYIGRNWSSNGYWHQFEKVGEPGVVWCEVLDHDLARFEESEPAPASPLPEATEPVAQAPAQAGEAWTRAMNAALTYRNADPEAIDEQDAWANLVDALGALATQPLAAPESIGWAAFDTRENRMRTRCETLEQIEAYIQQQHQSRDDITLYKRPIFAGDRS